MNIADHPDKVVKIEDIDMPKIKSNEVLIKVEAAHITTMICGLFLANPLKFHYLTFQELM